VFSNAFARAAWTVDRLRSMTSAERRGRGLSGRRDFQRQKRRHPCRCQRRIVSGFTSRTVSRQLWTSLQSITSRPRSSGRRTGRLTLREATISCWRSSACSASSTLRARRLGDAKWLGVRGQRHGAPTDGERESSHDRAGQRAFGGRNDVFADHRSRSESPASAEAEIGLHPLGSSGATTGGSCNILARV
jgi:hypothetical protein